MITITSLLNSLLKSKPTMLEIEKSLSSNICRCTGYRSILEAFRKFAIDAPDQINVSDIEDLQVCKKDKESCSNECSEKEWCLISKNVEEEGLLCVKLKDGRKWYRVSTVSDIFDILHRNGTDSYMLVAGNTGKGNYIYLCDF